MSVSARDSNMSSLSPMNTLVDHEERALLVENSESDNHRFENLEQQHDSKGATLKAVECQDSTWLYLSVEAIGCLFLQLMLGGWDFMRAIFLGQAVKWILDFIPLNTPSWLSHYETLFYKVDSHVLLPPSFLVLATLTIVALIVHPDGLTWILWDKVRNGVWNGLKATCTCWDIVVNEHGTVISVILAGSTVGVLFFVIHLLKQASFSNVEPVAKPIRDVPSPSCTKSQPKARKKKRGGSSRAAKRIGKSRQTEETRSTQDSDEASHELSSVNASFEAQSSNSFDSDTKPAVATECVSQKPVIPNKDNASHQPPKIILTLAADSLDCGVSCSTTESTSSSLTSELSSSGLLPHQTPGHSYKDVPCSKAQSSGYITGRQSPHKPTPPTGGRRSNPRRRNGRKSTPNHLKPSPKTANSVPENTTSRWDALKPNVDTNRSEYNRTERETGSNGTPVRAAKQRGSPNSPFPTVSSPASYNLSPVQMSLNAQCRPFVPSSMRASASLTPPPGVNLPTPPGVNLLTPPGGRMQETSHMHPVKSSSESSLLSLFPPSNDTDQSHQKTSLFSYSFDQTIQKKAIPAPPGLGGPCNSFPADTYLSSSFAIPSLDKNLLPTPPPYSDFGSLYRGQEQQQPAPTLTVKENPFEVSRPTNNLVYGRDDVGTLIDDEDDDELVANLQELGGRIVGSLLDC